MQSTFKMNFWKALWQAFVISFRTAIELTLLGLILLLFKVSPKIFLVLLGVGTLRILVFLIVKSKNVYADGNLLTVKRPLRIKKTFDMPLYDRNFITKSHMLFGLEIYTTTVLRLINKADGDITEIDLRFLRGKTVDLIRSAVSRTGGGF